MGFFNKDKAGDLKKAVKVTSGECCVCHRSIFRNPDADDKLDNAARYCRECGTDICVHCLQKLEGKPMKICPVCGNAAYFEINPLFRP